MESLTSPVAMAQTATNDALKLTASGNDRAARSTTSFSAEIDAASSRAGKTEQKPLGGPDSTSRRKSSCAAKKPPSTENHANPGPARDPGGLLVPQIIPAVVLSSSEASAADDGGVRQFPAGVTGGLPLQLRDDNGEVQPQQSSVEAGRDSAPGAPEAGIALALRQVLPEGLALTDAVMKDNGGEHPGHPQKLASEATNQGTDGPAKTLAIPLRVSESNDSRASTQGLADLVSAKLGNLPGTARFLVAPANPARSVAAASPVASPALSSHPSGKTDHPAVPQGSAGSPDTAPEAAAPLAAADAKAGAESDDGSSQQQPSAKSGEDDGSKNARESSARSQFLMTGVPGHDSSASPLAKGGGESAVPADRTRFWPEPGEAQSSVWNPDKAVNAGQSLEQIARGDLRLAIQTDSLGNVELHARLAGDQLGAAITVDKKDAHAVLATELPALHQALSEKRFRVEELSLSQGTFDASAGNAQQSFSQRPGTPFPATGERKTHWGRGDAPAETSRFSAGPAEAYGIFDSRGRLSVHV